MAWSDFYIQTTGSNLNAGSTNADAAVYTSTAGNFDGTSVFTPTDGQTTTSLVNVNDWASIYPTGNTTTPYVAQVTAVGAGVNGTFTLSTTAKFGTAPTNNSGSRNCKTGGAWQDLGMLAAGVALNTGTVGQSTRVNIKAGTYANTSTTRTFTLGGATTKPLWWRGYKTAIGDQDANNTAVAGTDIPSITFTTGQISIPSGATYQTFSNLDFSGAYLAGATGQVSVAANYVRFYGCRFTNTAANANGIALQFASTATICWVVRCWIKATATASACVIVNGVQSYFRGCTITSGIIGLSLVAATNLVEACVFDSQAGDAIKTGVPCWIIGCSFYAPLGNGINLTAIGANSVIVANCYFSTVNQASKAAINNTSGTNSALVTAIGNAYFACTANVTGITENVLFADAGTLGSEAFHAPGSQDFSINPVGQALGVPGPFENVSVYKGYLDVGAVQHLATGGPTGQIMRVSGQHFMAG